MTHLSSIAADLISMHRLDVVLVRGLSAVAGVVSAVVAVAFSGAMRVQERRTVPVRVTRRSTSA
ncbi:MAG: hypothetical protein AB7V43_23325 [Acidimicrobiia bacterium]